MCLRNSRRKRLVGASIINGESKALMFPHVDPMRYEANEELQELLPVNPVDIQLFFIERGNVKHWSANTVASSDYHCTHNTART